MAGEKKDKQWVNPLERFELDTPAGVIARTAARLYRECPKKDLPLKRTHRKQVFEERYHWSSEAIDSFEVYVSGMTKAEAKRAEQYGKEHVEKEDFAYQSKTLDRYILQQMYRRTGRNFAAVKRFFDTLPAEQNQIRS